MSDRVGQADQGRQLAAASRRIAELNDIVDASREASLAQGVESACRALVRAASRAVPRAEVVFVGLRQPETGDLHVVVSSGLVSPEFRYGRAPSGAGLWGKAEHQLLPVRVDDYFTNSGLVHDVELDGACRADGVTSAICVPLVVGGAAIGAVYTMGRTTGMFYDGDVTKLSDLASAVAPAIHRAVGAKELQSAMAELAGSRRRMGRSIAAFDELLVRVLAGASVVDVIDAVVTSVDGAVAALAVDAADRELVASPIDSELDPLRDRWILDGIAGARSGGDPLVVPQAPHGTATAVFVPVAEGDRYVGTVLVVLSRAVDDTDIRSLQRLAGLLALALGRRSEPGDSSGTINAVVLRGLLTTRGVVAADSRRSAELAGVDFGAQWVVGAVALPPRTDPGAVVRVLNESAVGLDGALVLDGSVVVVTRAGAASIIAERIGAAILAHVGIEPLVCTSEVVDPASGDFARQHDAVMVSIGLLQSLGRTRGTFDVADLPAHLPLLRAATVDGVRRFLDGTVGPLVEFDRHNSADLVRTVRVYFAADMNTAATARELDLHANTVIKRLRRVSELLGPDWRSEQESLPLRLALNLHALAVDGE